MYADYNYYLTKYLHKDSGLLSVTDFPVFAEKAGAKMDYLAWGRIQGSRADLDEVKSCCCELAEAIFLFERARDNESGAPVSSWSNDGESGSYDMASSNLTNEGHEKHVGAIARKYLLRLGLLSRRC